jgi:serine protease Do
MVRSPLCGRAALFLPFIFMSVVSACAFARDLPDFTDLAEKSSPAVVNISTTTKASHGLKPGPNGDDSDQGDQAPEGRAPGTPFDDFLRRFFGDEYPPGGPNGPEDFEEKSLGSGFIISSDGYILTNNHVVSGADEIVVRLGDRREFDAKIVGTDKRSDVALLKINADKLPVAKIGTSKGLKVGSWVIAIGSPFGFEHSVTAGIVSAMGRSLPNENYTPFIQTDVAINPGNSGGPLINMNGEVVGINSQIFSRTGGFMGLSFAIPIDLAMNVVDQLRTTGHVTRGWLGILIQDVTRELAESFGMPKPVGALVARVLPDSPAAAAGIKVGDVIMEYQGKEIESSSELPPLVGSTPVGSQAELRIMRDGKIRTVKIAIKELPEEAEVALEGPGAPSTPVERLNVTVANLTAEQRSELEGKSGVVVESVREGAAYKAGIRRGDVLLRFNNVEIKDAAHFKQLVKDAPKGKSVPVLIQRRGNPVFLALKLDAG